MQRPIGHDVRRHTEPLRQIQFQPGQIEQRPPAFELYQEVQIAVGSLLAACARPEEASTAYSVLPQDRDDPVLEVSHACVHRHQDTTSGKRFRLTSAFPVQMT